VADPSLALTQGDRVAVRCTMLSYSTRLVKQGLASYEEM
jgi:hypothetical protein